MEARLSRAAAERREPAVAPGTELAAAARLLAEDLPHLVREELTLLKLEAQAAIVRAGVASALGVGVFLGSFFVFMGLAILISQALDRPWTGPVIVGTVLVLAGAAGVPLLLRKKSAA